MPFARWLLRSASACWLLTSFAASPLAAAAASARPAPTTTAQVDRPALLLQRLSFGARPGELQRVRAQGVDAWLEQQLHPERIDDSALERRLDAYPALRLTEAEQIARYPTPAMVRNAAKTGRSPDDPELRAILQSQVEFYQMRQDNKAAKAVTAQGGSAAQNGVSGFAMDGDVATSEASADGMAKTKSRSQLAGGGSTATDAAAPLAAAPNLEQATPAMPQAEVSALLELAPAERYQRLLQMSPAALIAARKGVRGDVARLAEGMTPQQRETLAALQGTNRMISGELFGARLLRDVYSERQLEAVMTDFWLNHFNVYIRKNGNMPSLLPEYVETVRAHALGRFEDLLEATAKSPAMLVYLDNAESVGPDSVAAGRPRKPGAKKQTVGLNENYARELMELHTLGVNGGYTQQDVTEVAKVFTGWGVERPGEGGAFVFNERRHEPGSKQVLGTTVPEAGESEGEQVLHMLATSPATAHFLSLELAERFVSDTPAPALVKRMAQTFLKTHGDIAAVLRTMVHAPEFFAPSTVNAKIKTPLEYVVSAVRATGAEVSNPLPLAQALERLGMPLYGAQPPTGYKWDAATWLNSAALVNRMNFALLFSADRVAGTTVDPASLAASASAVFRPVSGTNANDASVGRERALESVVLPAGVSAQTRSAVLSQTDDAAVQQAMQDFAQAGTSGGRLTGAKQIVRVNRRDFGSAAARPGVPPTDAGSAVMLGLLLGSPEFQRR